MNCNIKGTAKKIKSHTIFHPFFHQHCPKSQESDLNCFPYVFFRAILEKLMKKFSARQADWQSEECFPQSSLNVCLISPQDHICSWRPKFFKRRENQDLDY